MKLVPIPPEKYNDYRLTAMFDCYKWDPQFEDHNTIAKHALVLSQEEYQELKQLTEDIDRETRAAEEFLNTHPKCAKPLTLSSKLRREIASMKNYNPEKHIRLMRYDFHPIEEGGWAVSEVNSDVPGGFAEASLLPIAAKEAIGDNTLWFDNFGEIITKAIVKKVKACGTIAMVHCTCYSDDRQVMQYLGDRLAKEGFNVIQCAADHIRFIDKNASYNKPESYTAVSVLGELSSDIDAIIRFNPLEWVKDIKPKYWSEFFCTETVSCNHPIAIFAQTKKFPFVWDILEQNGIPMSTWRKLLPHTTTVKKAKGKDGYIYKPVYGRVGENIGIREACSDKEYRKILREVKFFPHKYLAQKRFNSKPLIDEAGHEYHVCLGSYTVDGKHAGFYARVSETPRIDSNAADIPVLIEGSLKNEQ